jgi:hypothetical protein
VAFRLPNTSLFTRIPVAAWFPPGDDLATLMACLCILREDLYIEFKGLFDEPIPLLDQCSAAYRRTYFYKNQYRTLHEINRCIHKVWQHREFIAEVYKLHPKIKVELKRINKMLGQAQKFVEGVRNDVGAHLQPSAVRDGLPNIPADTICLWQQGSSPDTIHYPFALEILGATMLRHVPLSDAQKASDDSFELMKRLGIDALNFIDALFHCYSVVRKLPVDSSQSDQRWLRLVGQCSPFLKWRLADC